MAIEVTIQWFTHSIPYFLTIYNLCLPNIHGLKCHEKCHQSYIIPEKIGLWN